MEYLYCSWCLSCLLSTDRCLLFTVENLHFIFFCIWIIPYSFSNSVEKCSCLSSTEEILLSRTGILIWHLWETVQYIKKWRCLIAYYLHVSLQLSFLSITSFIKRLQWAQYPGIFICCLSEFVQRKNVKRQLCSKKAMSCVDTCYSVHIRCFYHGAVAL